MFWLCRLLCPLYVANSIGLVTVSMIVGDTCTGTHMPMCDVVYVETRVYIINLLSLWVAV